MESLHGNYVSNFKLMGVLICYDFVVLVVLDLDPDRI